MCRFFAVLQVRVNCGKRFLGDCEGMIHDAGDDDHTYELAEEHSELNNYVRKTGLDRAYDVLALLSAVER